MPGTLSPATNNVLSAAECSLFLACDVQRPHKRFGPLRFGSIWHERGGIANHWLAFSIVASTRVPCMTIYPRYITGPVLHLQSVSRAQQVDSVRLPRHHALAAARHSHRLLAFKELSWATAQSAAARELYNAVHWD